jgi:maltoporin
VSKPFGYSIDHPARIGLEVVGQGGGKNGNNSNSFQVGPTLEYAWTPNFRTTGVVGFKTVGGSFNGVKSQRENAAYFKLEFSLSP